MHLFRPLRTLVPAVALAFVSVAAAPAVAQDDQAAASLFGEPLFVNGERISDQMIMRYIVYGPGRGILDMRKRQLLIDDQIERTKERLGAEGQTFDPSKYYVTEEEWLRAHDERVGKFSVQFPFSDLETELRRAYGSVDLYEVAEKQSLQFRKVFIPLNPYEWPIETVEAVRPEADGMVLQDAYKTWEDRKRLLEEEGVEMREEGDMYIDYIRDVVETALISTWDVKTYSDGIDPSLAMVMDDGIGEGPDLVVTLQEIYDEVIPFMDDYQIDQVKRFCARVVASRQALEKAGVLMPKEEFDPLYEELAKQSTSFFTMETVALYTDYFPSIEHFKAYFLLARSHDKLIQPEFVAPEGARLSPALEEHLPTANRIMGLGKADTEVILLSAFDTENYRWKENGWETAREMADRLRNLLDENKVLWDDQLARQLEASRDGTPFAQDPNLKNPYEFWTALREEYCEYWDAPPPLDGGQQNDNKGTSNVGYRNKGKWGEKTRHDQQTFLGESHYIHWVNGYSISDRAFFDQEPGTVEGPFKGPQGYYLTYLVRRMPPTHPLRVREDNHLELLKQSYGRWKFVEFCNEAFESAEIRGLSKS